MIDNGNLSNLNGRSSIVHDQRNNRIFNSFAYKKRLVILILDVTNGNQLYNPHIDKKTPDVQNVYSSAYFKENLFILVQLNGLLDIIKYSVTTADN